MDYDRQRSRVPLPEKVHKGKAIPIGPHVMLDQERCILCSRCIRFLDEVTQTQRARLLRARRPQRARRSRPGKTLDNPYSGNVVDICPVGALTNRDFRFRARVWYLERTESVCGGCANGCNIEIYHREGRIFRFQPRFNPDVNQYWMCDAGRMTAITRCRARAASLQPLRARRRRVRAAPTGRPRSPAVGERLAALARAHGPGAVGVVVSAQAPNEEIFLLRRLGERPRARARGHRRGRRPTPTTTTSSSRPTRTRTRRASRLQGVAARTARSTRCSPRPRRARCRRSCSAAPT